MTKKFDQEILAVEPVIDWFKVENQKLSIISKILIKIL